MIIACAYNLKSEVAETVGGTPEVELPSGPRLEDGLGGDRPEVVLTGGCRPEVELPTGGAPEFEEPPGVAAEVGLIAIPEGVVGPGILEVDEAPATTVELPSALEVELQGTPEVDELPGPVVELSEPTARAGETRFA